MAEHPESTGNTGGGPLAKRVKVESPTDASLSNLINQLPDELICGSDQNVQTTEDHTAERHPQLNQLLSSIPCDNTDSSQTGIEISNGPPPPNKGLASHFTQYQQTVPTSFVSNNIQTQRIQPQSIHIMGNHSNVITTNGPQFCPVSSSMGNHNSMIINSSLANIQSKLVTNSQGSIVVANSDISNSSPMGLSMVHSNNSQVNVMPSMNAIPNNVVAPRVQLPNMVKQLSQHAGIETDNNEQYNHVGNTVVTSTMPNPRYPSGMPSQNLTPAADPAKRHLIQQQLVLLLHAHKCQQKEQTSGGVNSVCTLQHCRTMKHVLNHMTDCSAGKACPVAHCASSRQIITHWKNCSRPDCPVCKPLKNSTDVRNLNSKPIRGQPTDSQQMHQAYPHHGLPGPSPYQSGGMSNHIGQIIGTNSQGVSVSDVVAQLQVIPAGHAPHYPLISDGIVAPSKKQLWHEQVRPDLRDHLVLKLVKAIFPTPDPSAMRDQRMANLVAYAQKVEGDMYELASSREEYYHLLAEKIYKIQKELEEKRIKRAQERNIQSHSRVDIARHGMPIRARIPNNSPLDGQRVNMFIQSPQMTSPGQTTLTNLPQGSMINTQWGMAPPSAPMPSQPPSVGSNPDIHMPTSVPNEPPSSVESMDRQRLHNHNEIKEEIIDNYAHEPKPNIKIEPPDYYATVSPMASKNIQEDVKPKLEVKQEHVSSTSDSSVLQLPNQKTDTSGARNPKVFAPEDLYSSLMQVLTKLYKQDPESLPFRSPVDPKALAIPDYLDIIKFPMDLSTIKKKLDTAKYTEPWQFIDDVYLMFQNAWTYNRKTSKVYKYCTKLSEVFEEAVDPVMKLLGFCCGGKHVFNPQILYCYSSKVCPIPPGEIFYAFENSTNINLLYDKYHLCIKCYNAIQGDLVVVSEDPTHQGNNTLNKFDFVEMRNNKIDVEPFCFCKECGRKFHQICVLHHNSIWPEFNCENCLRQIRKKRIPNKYTARRLPHNHLSRWIEKRVNQYVKMKEPNCGDVHIRVLSSSDKQLEIMSGMKSRFPELSECFPYRTRAIFAFEEIDDCEVCFFGMHVQEYGSECLPPNCRRVYISYLDSVHFFSPRYLRTMVYHEILIGYLEYVKKLGFTFGHIWACPPSEGDDYIFHCHPPEQKMPKAKRLQEWYKKMLDKAVTDKVIYDFRDVLSDAQEENLQSAADMAYFEGDFWPNVFEESIKELDQEEEERAAAALAQAGVEEDIVMEGKKGSKKVKKKHKSQINKKNKKGSAGGNDLLSKIFATMEKHKDVFFVIRLCSPEDALNAKPTEDPDQMVNCDLLDGRDAFLTMCREKHWEFSSLRRANYSTMSFLFEIHSLAQDRFLYTCNNCKISVETRWHCAICEDFDLCLICNEKVQHEHKLEKMGLGLDTPDNSESSPQESRRESIQRCIRSLVHACQCRDANCRLNSCQRMKKVIQHTKTCTKKRGPGVCQICKQLLALCCYHAKHCTEIRCPIPFCPNIKQKLKKQQQLQRLQHDQMQRRRMAAMQGRTSVMTTVQLPTQTNVPQQIQHGQAPPPANMCNVGMGKPGGPSPGVVQAVRQIQAQVLTQRQNMSPNGNAVPINRPSVIGPVVRGVPNQGGNMLPTMQPFNNPSFPSQVRLPSGMVTAQNQAYVQNSMGQQMGQLIPNNMTIHMNTLRNGPPGQKPQYNQDELCRYMKSHPEFLAQLIRQGNDQQMAGPQTMGAPGPGQGWPQQAHMGQNPVRQMFSTNQWNMVNMRPQSQSSPNSQNQYQANLPYGQQTRFSNMPPNGDDQMFQQTSLNR